MKKKLLITLLALTMAVSSAACTSSKNTSKTDKTEKKATESVAESVTETSTESTAVNEVVKGQESSEVSDTAAGVKADDSIAAGAATTDSRADSDNGSSSAGTSADKEKKSGKKAKDNKKSASSASAVSSNGSTASNNGSAASNAASSNHTKPASAAGSKGTDSSSGTANKTAAHTHTWVKYVANTIQHKEEGHYETKVVKEAYDEPKYEYHNVCNKCGYDAGIDTDGWSIVDHEVDCMGSWSNVPVQVGSIHHDAVTEQVYVVDQAAYTENVYGERCSGCGATK